MAILTLTKELDQEEGLTQQNGHQNFSLTPRQVIPPIHFYTSPKSLCLPSYPIQTEHGPFLFCSW